MKKRSRIFILFCLAAVVASGQTKISLIPTIHSLHKNNSLYNYDSVRAIVSRLKPDVIVVELRAMDISSDTNYLKKNYPYEMWMMRYWFPKKTIEGYDWLGEDLEGKPIPEKYWQEQSTIKKLERQLEQDSIYSKRFDACRHYAGQRLPLLKNKSLPEILKSSDSELIRNYYDCMKEQLNRSLYKELPDFYSERNRQMESGLSTIIKKHRGKTIVVLTGDDHYPCLLDYLKTLKVEWVPL